MPPPAADPYPDQHPSNSPRCKAQLLRYILAIKDEFRDRDPDYVSFFNYVANNFRFDGRLVFENPHKLYDFLTREVKVWTSESSGKAVKVRIGHEHGSDYDILMNTFGKSLDNIILDHWHWMVSQPRHALYLKFSEVPENYRAKVKKLYELHGKREVKPGDARIHANRAAGMLNASKTEMSHFQYDAVKLERVVNAAMKRAVEEGKPDLANSVHLIYTDSLKDMYLRELLEKTLTQRCSSEDIARFQEYVRAAKKKLKLDKATAKGNVSSPTRVSLKRSSTEATGNAQSQPDLQRPSKTPRLTQERESNRSQPMKSTAALANAIKSDQPRTKPGRLDRHHGTEDSGYGSEKAGGKADDGSTKRTGPSNDSSKHKTTPDTGTSSEEEAEREDLEEAKRASKRRRRAGSEGSEGSYRPSADAKRARSSRRLAKSQKSGQASQDSSLSSIPSSPLSSLPDEIDIEQAKEDYVDEMVRKQSAEASRKAIEEKYGPVSPSIVEVDARSEPTEDWASMPSPTMEPVKPAAVAHQAAKKAAEQATAGAQNGESQATMTADTQPIPAAVIVTAPQPEGFTPSEEAKAYKLITATVAESIAPYFKHMEAKLEKLESQQKLQASAPSVSLPSVEEIKKAAEAMKSGALRGNNSEVTQLIAQMLNNAAEASIHAADAARKAGEVARDVGKVLLLISPQNETKDEAPRNQRKKK